MIDISKGIPNEWRLDSILFSQYMYDAHDRVFIFEAEDADTDDFWYILFGGLKKITCNIPAFKTSELFIDIKGNDFSALLNGIETGIVFMSAKILSESEFEKFEDQLPVVSDPKVLSCLDK